MKVQSLMVIAFGSCLQFSYASTSLTCSVEQPPGYKSWDKFTTLEKAGATALGWDKAKWDCATSSCPKPASETKMWKALTSVEQAAAEKWGYTSVSWTKEKDWDNLDTDTQMAAQALGHNKNTWDCDGDCKTAAAKTKCWVDLSAVEQPASESLGWTKKLWDSCVSGKNCNASSAMRPDVLFGLITCMFVTVFVAIS
eukprot:CAMPEP_0172701160 /NCGR_PEP_ID=MMETSP1074-20121228/31436_1 /TAXON_ID=2916 /ORGANISM="Ceratium fusus, Strain PA161109" /LENGTH=196 /DNA_ID=CAMNT_0013522669 /DNA_START=21 /DNA_END=611 /DNA_ORIENTATION=+